MEKYIIQSCQNGLDWQKINTIQLKNYQWLPDIGIRMFAQLAYDSENLYIHLRAVEKDIRAEITTQNCAVCQDSCMEFFFRPLENDSRYMNFEVNLNGQFFMGVAHGRPDITRLTMNVDTEKELFQAQGNKTEDGWEIFYRIPASFIQLLFPEFALVSGKKIFANLYKCGDLTPQKHYIVWNKIELEKANYHCPEFFGEMTLE